MTGATSGIGAAFAERYARDGYDVILHGRRRERLMESAERLRSRHGVQTEVLVADLSISSDTRKMEAMVSADRDLCALINNAGVTPLLPFDDTDPDELEALISVHVIALTRLTRAALPGMMKRQRGTIINVASDGIFVRYPQSLMATYAATKAYVETFTRGICTLAANSNVRTQVLCPGYVTSEILDRHGISFEDWGIPASVVMSAEKCVEASMAALELGEVTCVPTLEDATLLDRLGAINEQIRQQSSGSAIPASRYSIGHSSGS